MNPFQLENMVTEMFYYLPDENIPIIAGVNKTCYKARKSFKGYDNKKKRRFDLFAIEYGSIDLFKRVKKSYDIDFFEKILLEGKYEILIEVSSYFSDFILHNLNHMETFGYSIFIQAAIKGKNLDCFSHVISLLEKFNIHKRLSISEYTARIGDEIFMRFLIDKGYHLGLSVFIGAISGGNMNVISLLISSGCEWKSVRSTYAAVASNNLEMLKYLRKRKCPWSVNIYLKAACVEKAFEFYDYLLTHKCPWDPDISESLLVNGKMEILLWLFNRNIKLTSTVLQELSKYIISRNIS